MEDNRARWTDVALTAVPAAVWGSTYAVTQEWLPPGRPLFAATVRALPVGLLLLLSVRRLPRRDWWWRSLVLGSLNIGLFYALLFVAAYRLPSGLGATLVATAPIVTMGVTRLLLSRRPERVSVLAALVGLVGVGLLVLQNGLDRPLDPVGLGAGLLAVLLSSTGFVLTKRWTPQAGVITTTSWQLVAGGLVLLPIGLVVEGAPPALDLPAVGALAYLGLLGSGLAYILWFRGLALLGPTPASIIGLVNPVIGVLLGVVLLGESFGPVHLAGMVLVVASVLVAQEPVRVAVSTRTRRSGRPVPWPPTRIAPSTSSSSGSAREESTSQAPSPSAVSPSSGSTAGSWAASAPTGAASPRR